MVLLNRERQLPKTDSLPGKGKISAAEASILASPAKADPPQSERPCKFACNWLISQIPDAYEWMELFDKDQCATTATKIFSQAAKPELRGRFH